MSQLLKIFFYEILIHVSYNYKYFFILIDDVNIGFFLCLFHFDSTVPREMNLKENILLNQLEKEYVKN